MESSRRVETRPSPDVSELTSDEFYEFAEQETALNEKSKLTEWTDEKHNMYLNSMESSFVNELYNHEKPPTRPNRAVSPGFEASPWIQHFQSGSRSSRSQAMEIDNWKPDNFNGLYYNSLQRYSDHYRAQDGSSDSEVTDQNFSDDDDEEKGVCSSKKIKTASNNDQFICTRYF